jgi:thiosulfate dehydrogenase [quinone] large subunit
MIYSRIFSKGDDIMLHLKAVNPSTSTQIPEPPLAKFLFSDTRMAWLWLIVRLYVGYEWLTAGLEKATGHSFEIGSFGQSTGSAWVFSGHDGAAMQGFVSGALAKASGAHPSVQGWYAAFLQHAVLPYAGAFAYIITFGEVFVGIALILGLLTGIASFFGVFMNMNYLLAGTVSTNPILGLLAIFLILGWRVAGYYGVDRYLLPLLGTPWTGSLTKTQEPIIPVVVHSPSL